VAMGIICEVCQREGEKEYLIDRQNIWDALPSYFSLPPWSELEGFDI